MQLKASKDFLQTALTNNSFDVDSTDKALRITLDHSFDYLYRLHRNVVCYEEHFFTSRNVIDQADYGDYFLDDRERVCANFPGSLILPHGREKFRCSKYYGKKINYEELKSDHVMFSRFPVITIDNQVVRDFNIEIFDDFFRVDFPFDRYFLRTKEFHEDRWEYGFVEHKTVVQLINNSYYEDITINTGMLKRNSYDGNSYDRVQLSYAQQLNPKIEKLENGTFFAVIYLGDEVLGSHLQDVTFDFFGDFVIHYDLETLEKLQAYSGNVTIRFIFYRDLYSYKSYRYRYTDIGKTIPMRTFGNETSSELFLIHKGEDKVYPVPIPTENLMVFCTRDGEYDNNLWKTRSQIPNTWVDIHYPNIYQVKGRLNENDRLRVFYFYMPPYELDYEYMYQFYYDYLQYRWPGMGLEEILNMIYFADDTLDVPEKVDSLVNLEKVFALRKAEEATKNEAFVERLENADVSALLDNPILKASEDWIPAKDFLELFHFIIEHPIVPYRYDEIDYVRKFEKDHTGIEYKVAKLKSFIKDDYKALHNYVRAQNKVGIKYEFSADSIDLDARYAEVNELTGEEFTEPMYLFPVTKPDPNVALAARIFINGFFCANFIYDRTEYTDYIYIPVSAVPEDPYFEIEVFASITQKESCVFSVDNPSVIIDFRSTEDITPTLSDIFFFEGREDNGTRLPLESFKLELISTRYNYYTEATPKEIQVYKQTKDGKVLEGIYYTIDGKCFTFDGQRQREKDLDTPTINSMIVSGELTLSTAYESADLMEIIRDTEYVTYDKVALGESTINVDNKGMNCTFLTKIQITLLDSALYGKEITVRIAKKPAYMSKKTPTIAFPLFTVPIENIGCAEEYVRAFRNGRLLSKNRYDFTTDEDGFLAIQTLERLPKGTIMALDFTPYRNRLIYYNSRIDSDLVDLRRYINKPFDPKFYEVYLNGRRLNKHNIYPISSYEFKLADCHSTYNLEIYEKDRDWEYYGLEFKDYLTLSDFIRKPFVDPDIIDRLIHDVTGDIPPNDDTEEPEDWECDLDLYSVYFEIFYYMRLIPLGFANPDTVQFSTEDIAKRFKIINDIYHKKNGKGEDVLLLNPDWHYKGTSKTRWSVYRTGHGPMDNLDEVEDINAYLERSE